MINKACQGMKEMQRSAFDSDHDTERGPEERRRLQENIRQWNSNRLSLFEITDPDEVNTFFLMLELLDNFTLSNYSEWNYLLGYLNPFKFPPKFQ